MSRPEPHIFEVELPDGSILEIEAPETTPVEQIRATAGQHWSKVSPAAQPDYKLKTAQMQSKAQFDLNRPAYSPGSAALGFVESFGVDPASPLLGTVKNLLRTGVEGAKAQAQGRTPFHAIQQGVGMLKGMAAGPQKAIEGYRTEDPNLLAEGVGQTIGTGAQILPAVPSGARGALNAVTTPERLMTRAANNRAPFNQFQRYSDDFLASGLGGAAGWATGLGPLGAAAGTIAGEGLNVLRQSRPVRSAKAGLQERVARFMSKKDQPPPPPVERPATPARTVEISNGPLPYDYGIDPLAQKPPAGPARPIEPSVQLDNRIPIDPLEQRPPSGPARSIEMPTPRPRESYDMQFQAESALDGPAGPPRQIEMHRPLDPATPAAQPAMLSPAQRNLADGIAATGQGLKWMDRNANALLQELPDLATTPPGRQFDAKLMKGLHQMEEGINAAEDLVRPESTVPRSSVISKWQEIVQDYADRGLARSANAVQELINTWTTKLPEVIPWEQFRDAKRAFFKDQKSSINSAPLRRAYGSLMDTAAEVGGEGLANANRRYSIVRGALDAAGISPATGQRYSNYKKSSDPKVDRVKRLRGL